LNDIEPAQGMLEQQQTHFLSNPCGEHFLIEITVVENPRDTQAGFT